MSQCGWMLMSNLDFSGSRGDTATLRSAKSEESLSSLHNVEGTFTTALSQSSNCQNNG